MRTIKKPQKQKKHSFKIWAHRIFIVFLIIVFVSLIGLCLCAFYNGYAQKKWNILTNKFYTTLEDVGFKLNNEAFILGRKRTSKEEIIKALNISDDKLITRLDLKRIQNNLEKLPWVERASVRRQLPDILHIYLNERKPIALWQKDKKHFPVDEKGNVVNAMCDECVYLPIVVGKNAHQKAPELINALEKFETLYTRTLSASLISSRRWNLYIDDIENGVIVLLPDTNLMESLKRLNDLQKEHGILDKKIRKIDLRQNDRIIIKPDGKDAIISNKKGER